MAKKSKKAAKYTQFSGTKSGKARSDTKRNFGFSIESLVDAGVIVPYETILKVKYAGEVGLAYVTEDFEVAFSDGPLDGETFSSLSEAGREFKVACGAVAHVRVDGWTFFKLHDRPLSEYRNVKAVKKAA